MTDNSDKAEQMLSQSNEKRFETDPADDTRPSLKEAIVRELEAIEAGEKPQNLTVRDGNLVALLDGLQEAGDLEAIVDDARAALGRDGDTVSRSEAARLLIRVGLAQVDSTVIGIATEAREEHQTKDIQF